MPYAVVSPNWNSYVVVAPLGLTTPVTVAEVELTPLTGPVATAGGG